MIAKLKKLEEEVTMAANIWKVYECSELPSEYLVKWSERLKEIENDTERVLDCLKLIGRMVCKSCNMADSGSEKNFRCCGIGSSIADLIDRFERDQKETVKQ